MNAKTLILLGVLVLSGCSTVNSPVHLTWTEEYLTGKTIEQESDTIVNRFSFARGGYCPATIGAKGGYTAAPLLRWRIDAEGRLILSDGDSANHPPLTLVEKEKDVLLVSLPNGKKLRFRILSDKT
jgi:hypothetical protein